MESPRRGLAWSFTERYVNLAISVSTSIALTRLLTPAQIGVFSLCAAVMAVASTVRDFGISDFIVQERDLTEQKLRGAYGVAIITSWSMGLAIFAMRDVMASYYEDPAISSLVAILMLGFLLLPFASPAYALMARDMSFRKIFIVQLATTVGQSLTSLYLAYRGLGPYSLAWGVVAGVALQAITVTLLRPKASLLLPSFRGTRAIFRFGTYQMTSRVLDTITSSTHEFVIPRLFGFAELGYFSRAKSLVDMFHNNVTGALTRVATPTFATAHRNNESLVQRFSRGTAILSCVSWPFFTFLALAAPEIVRVMYGPQWNRAVGLVTLLSLAMLPTALSTLSGAVMSAVGAVERRLTISLKWCPIHLAGLFVGSLISFEAMALAWLLTNTVIAVLFAVELRAMLRTTMSALFRASRVSFWIACCTSAVGYALLAATRQAGWPPIVNALLAGVGASLVWLVAVWWLAHPVYQELVRAAASIRPRRALASS